MTTKAKKTDGAKQSRKTATTLKTAAPVAASETSETSMPTTATTVVEATTVQKETKMENFTLVRGTTSKNGKRIQFTNPALPRNLVLPVSLFANGAPESLTLSGEGFRTRNADEQAKAEARNAKRAAKGLKPVMTPQERLARLTASAAKRAAQMERAQKAAAKLAAKLGVEAPSGAIAEAAPATEGATV